VLHAQNHSVRGLRKRVVRDRRNRNQSGVSPSTTMKSPAATTRRRCLAPPWSATINARKGMASEIPSPVDGTRQCRPRRTSQSLYRCFSLARTRLDRALWTRLTGWSSSRDRNTSRRRFIHHAGSGSSRIVAESDPSAETNLLAFRQRVIVRRLHISPHSLQRKSAIERSASRNFHRQLDRAFE
jgi:hypothetical protein